MAIPVLNSSQVKALDRLTIETEPLSSLELMERASWRLVNSLLNEACGYQKFHFICGPGNNGGDGLCMARILAGKGYKVKVSLVDGHKQPSIENQLNRSMAINLRQIKIVYINAIEDFSSEKDECIVDCLFGSGLKKPPEGIFRQVIELINEKTKSTIISIDVPSGLTDTGAPLWNTFIHSDQTLCIQHPRPTLLYNENRISFKITDIGLAKPPSGENPLLYLDPIFSKSYISDLLPKPDAFAHKGTRGHLLLIGGSYDKSGAIKLSTQSAIKAGCGLVTVASVPSAKLYLSTLPEAMFTPLKHLEELDFTVFKAIAAGPGMGINLPLLNTILSKKPAQLVLDADALNTLAQNPELWQKLPANTILTPHPKEFERLFGSTQNSEEKIQLMLKISAERNVIIVAKNKYTYISSPQGQLFVNGSGDHLLAKGGSGDKLTGRIGAYLAQGLPPLHASLAGAFLV